MKDYFPSQEEFAEVCTRGLSAIRPLLPSARERDGYGWNFGTARPPSYAAYGRLRATMTFKVAASFGAKRVLEVAAGDASLSAALQQQGCEVVVNDLRDEDIREAVRHFSNAEAIRVAGGNVFDLDPKEIGEFDLVIACELIEHVADPVALLRKLKSFLAPGGRVMVTTPNGAYFRNKLPTYRKVKNHAALFEKQFKPDADGHLYLLTSQEVFDLSREAGFQVEQCFAWGTPFISGESGFRVLGGVLPRLTCLALEKISCALPAGVREQWGNSLMVVLKDG
jgi:2-polyprenyl-3-methyl-5-hydroxy-6-metoxy-1,4-benzoquinol methylase